jgi:16S rRNA (adenine1518-N6/adenine1519-N6)-dimethyltransferase
MIMKTRANKYNAIYPRKRLGQHFLVDKNIVKKILSVAHIREGEHIIEIGPGLGALTEGLLESGAKVTAIEVDPRLIDRLLERVHEVFVGAKTLEVLRKDALKVSYTELSHKKGTRFKVVSNLPYNISGPILFKFLSERRAFTRLVLMLQKEVARRLVSGPGIKDYGVLSVLAQTYTDPRCEFDVQPTSFTPRPKVTSTIVSLRVLDSPRVNVYNERFFKTVVESAFGQRRKTLLNSLKTLGRPAGEIKRVLEELGIDPKRRGETLTLEEFSNLTGALLSLNIS